MNRPIYSTQAPERATGTQQEHTCSKVYTLLAEAQDFISVVAELLKYKSLSSIADDPAVAVLKSAMAKIDEISFILDEGEAKL